MQAQLDGGQSISALRRFSDNLAKLPQHGWGRVLLCFRLQHAMLYILCICCIDLYAVDFRGQVEACDG